MSNRPVEDIQNRVRNYLSPIATLHELVKDIISHDADDQKSIIMYNYLVKSDLLNNVEKSINKIIEVAAAADIKINDKNFCIEDLMEEIRNKNSN